MVKLILSTGNIVSGGPSIIRKPGAYRSNLELTNSLRSNFLAAQEYWAAAAAADAENSPAHNGNGNGNGSHAPSNGLNGWSRSSMPVAGAGRRTPPYVWTEWRKVDAQGREVKEGGEAADVVLYIPRIDWSASGLQEEPSRYDITVKLFFLPETRNISGGVGVIPTATKQSLAAERAGYAREALELVRRELGDAPSVDLLIVSFPGMSFEGDCEWEADKTNAAQGDDDVEVATWLAVADELQARRGLVKRLGIAEFGSEKLARFLRRVGDRGGARPSVDQINVKNCCNVPPPLVELAKEQGIELLVHSDCTDILPKGTLRELLGPGVRGAGILAGEGDDADEDDGYAADRLQGEITPQWVVKYTAVVRDRGVIENKGYFAGALLSTPK